MNDLISRQDAIDALYALATATDNDDVAAGIIIAMGKVQGVSQKTGKWMIEDCHAVTYKYCCSECNAHHRARYDFCPTCGARMVGDEE